MSMYLTRSGDPARGRDWGVGPQLPYGYAPPISVILGLGEMQRMGQPDRMVLADPSPNPGQVRPRLQDPRTLDAGRLLDFGAPAPASVVEYAAVSYRPTEAPQRYQVQRALGGRYVEVR